MEKYIALPCDHDACRDDIRVFFLEKKYPFAVLLLECEESPKPCREE